LNLRIVTVATKELINTDTYLYLKDTVKENLNRDLITLGADDTWNGGDLTQSPGGGKKVVYLKEYLNSNKFSFDDYMLFCDGGDTFCNSVITDTDILDILPYECIFAGESSYWPDWDLSEKFGSEDDHGVYRFLNSGLFIGRTNYIKELLNKYSLLDYDYADTKKSELVDDQYYYQNIYLEESKICIDYDQKYFKCLGPIFDPNGIIEVGNSYFVHANGNAKQWYEENIVAPVVAGLPVMTSLPVTKGVEGPSISKSSDTSDFGCIIITLDRDETDAKIPGLLEMNPMLSKDNIHILEGVKGTDVDKTYLDERGWSLFPWRVDDSRMYYKWYNADLNSSDIGCGISHAMSWDLSVKLDYKYTLILEQDFIPVEPIDLDLYDFPDEVGLIYLDRIKIIKDAMEVPYGNGYVKDNIISNMGWVYPSKSYNLTAYILTRVGAKSLQDQNFYDKIMISDEFVPACYGKTDRDDLMKIIMPDLIAVAPENGFQWFQQESEEGMVEYKTPRIDTSILPSIQNKDWNLLIEPVDLYMYSIPLLHKEWCDWIIQEAEKINQWSAGRHTFYSTYDILLQNIDEKLNTDYCNMLQEYMVESATHFYQLDGEQWGNLKFENFLVKYSTDTQPSLGVHHDSSLLSTVMTLNDKSEFIGGGTWFARQQNLHFGRVGHLSVHPGNITHKHGARAVTSGTRYVIISFSNYNE
jgi:hypothetical protein